MKRTMLAAAAALIATAALAQQPASLPVTSISLEVKNVAAGKQAANSFVTDYGSYDKTFTRQREIAIAVRNMSNNPVGAIKARIYWIGKATATNKKELLKKSEKPLDAAGRFASTWNENSGTVVGADMNLTMIGVRQTSGSRIDGWVVTLEDAAGKLLAVKGSDAYLETLAKTPGAIGALPGGSR